MMIQAVVVGMAGKVTLDDHGCITLPERVRDRYGDRFRIVELDTGVKLVPIPDNPVAVLRAAAGDDLREAPLPVLERAARKEAREQTDGEGQQ